MKANREVTEPQFFVSQVPLKERQVKNLKEILNLSTLAAKSPIVTKGAWINLRWKKINNRQGCGGGSVGRAVTSDISDPLFESHQTALSMNSNRKWRKSRMERLILKNILKKTNAIEIILFSSFLTTFLAFILIFRDCECVGVSPNYLALWRFSKGICSRHPHLL